jgi:hypothetical protein
MSDTYWAIIELMGHVRMAGKVSEEQRFGATVGRVDIPVGAGFVTQRFGGQALFRETACTEEIARAVAAANPPQPVHPWEIERGQRLLAAGSPTSGTPPADVDHDELGVDDVCPGSGRCHGAVGWCDECGNVSDVCDDAACDVHRAAVAWRCPEHGCEASDENHAGGYDFDYCGTCCRWWRGDGQQMPIDFDPSTMEEHEGEEPAATERPGLSAADRQLAAALANMRAADAAAEEPPPDWKPGDDMPF